MRSANTLPFILQEIAIIPTYDLRRTTYAARMQQPIPYVCLETVEHKSRPKGACLEQHVEDVVTVSKTYVWYGMLYTAGVRRDNRETKIFWSIKQSDFARLVSFPSSSRRVRISSSGPLGKEMVDCRWRWEMV